MKAMRWLGIRTPEEYEACPVMWIEMAGIILRAEEDAANFRMQRMFS